jgi:hypothetical protein
MLREAALRPAGEWRNGVSLAWTRTRPTHPLAQTQHLFPTEQSLNPQTDSIICKVTVEHSSSCEARHSSAVDLATDSASDHWRSREVTQEPEVPIISHRRIDHNCLFNHRVTDAARFAYAENVRFGILDISNDRAHHGCFGSTS